MNKDRQTDRQTDKGRVMSCLPIPESQSVCVLIGCLNKEDFLEGDGVDTGVSACAVLYHIEHHGEVLFVRHLDPAILVCVVAPEHVRQPLQEDTVFS